MRAGRLADEADAAGGEIGAAAEIVEEAARGVAAHRVDREVAARGVGGEVPREADLGVAAVGQRRPRAAW